MLGRYFLVTSRVANSSAFRIHIGNVDERSRSQMSVANLRIATTLLQLAAYYHVEIQLRHCWNLLMIQKLESWVYM